MTMAPGLSFEALTVEKNGVVILRDVTARLPAGKLTLLIGPNGAGKSTLLRAAAGLEPPAHGHIRIDGRDAGALTLAERARLIAWVPDHADVPFAFTVIDAVLMGRFPWHQGTPRRLDREAAAAATETLGVGHLKDRPLTALSSGERQKTMIARALAGEAAVLLFDEPCANLDVGAALRLLRLLQSLAKGGKTVCVSLHDIGLAYRFAEHALCLAGGELAAAGGRDEVFAPSILDPVFQVRSGLGQGLQFEV